MSRSIVEAHDGRLEVRSVPGEGTCFSLVLPRLDPAGAGVSERAAAPANKAPAVQRRPRCCSSTTTRWWDAAWRVPCERLGSWWSVGAEALEHLEEHLSCRGSDVRMPGMNGWSCTTRYKSERPCPSSSSPSTTESERAELLRLGCPVLRKPVGNQRLLSECSRSCPRAPPPPGVRAVSTRWGAS